MLSVVMRLDWNGINLVVVVARGRKVAWFNAGLAGPSRRGPRHSSLPEWAGKLLQISSSGKHTVLKTLFMLRIDARLQTCFVKGTHMLRTTHDFHLLSNITRNLWIYMG